MPWVKIDDQFHSNPKVVAAGSEAIALYIVALSWSGGYLTDGHIPETQVRRLALCNDYEAAAQRLVEVGLWHETEGGYQINDYLEYNPSGKEVKEKRKATAERVAAWRERQRDEEDNGEDDNAVRNGVTNGDTNSSSRTRTRPRPHANNTDMGADAPPEPQSSERQPSEKDLVRKALELHFADVTGLPRPKTNTQKQKRAAGTLWWGPLREIAELCEWDEGEAKLLVSLTVEHLRQGNCTIANPKSIEKTARAVYTGNAPGVAMPRDGPKRTYDDFEIIEGPDGKPLAREVKK